MSFTVGDRYVVYAYREGSAMPVTSMCTRTRPLSDPHTRADIAYFDRRERNTSGGLLTGVVHDVTADLSVARARPRPLEGIRITASAETGGDPARTTLTRSDGSYELTGLPPGRLRVTANLPSQFEPPPPVTAVMTAGCAETDIVAQLDGRIRGQLFDEGGRPARGIDVRLADAAIVRSGVFPLNTMSALTDEEGTFEFRHVNVGRYVVGVGLGNPVRSGKLNRRRFHPNTLDVDTATVVTLGAAEHLELPAFRLAPLPPDRVITIVVHAPSIDVAGATRLFLTGAQRERLAPRDAPLPLKLPFGAQYLIEATPPSGYRIVQPSIVQIDRDDTDRTVEFRVEK